MERIMKVIHQLGGSIRGDVYDCQGMSYQCRHLANQFEQQIYAR